MPTKIEWAEETWNPVTGCTKVSPGCRNCYAERMARRLAGRYGYPEAPHHFDVTLHPDKLDQPLRWKKPRVVFVCSMGDLFHENVPLDYLRMVFDAMYLVPQHTFMILTKRPQRMLQTLTNNQAYLDDGYEWPLENVWYGVSVENQKAANERTSLLAKTPAAMKIISLEPLLGPVDLYRAVGLKRNQHGHAVMGETIDLVIVGGESGPGARPMNPRWARNVRDQCQEAGVAFFMKQMSKKAPIPNDLMIREFPGDTGEET